MKTTRNIILTGTLCALAMTTALRADVPAARTPVTTGIINYQGRLMTPAANFYSNGVYTIEFRMYEVETGVSSGLWACAYPVYVKDGYFNVMLGGPGGSPVTPAPTYGPTELWRALWYDAANPTKANDRYLGLKVVSGPDPALPDPAVEAFPRQRLLSAPFAERAQMAQYARAAFDTFTVGTTLTVTGLVTAVGGVTAKNTTTLTNTMVNGTITLNQGLTVSNQQAVFNKGLSVTGDVTYVRAGLDVTGVALLKGGVNTATAKVQENGNDLIPRGVIVMWHGAAAPAGWALCDGANGTPDLRGRFVLSSGAGAGLTARTWKDAGGEERHTLTTAEIPEHEHDFNVHTVGYGIWYNDGAEATAAPDNGRNNGTQSQDTGNTGGGGSHNNMPPFFVLAYIMKL